MFHVKHSTREMKKSIMEMEISCRTAILNDMACKLYTRADKIPATSESTINQVMTALITTNENARKGV